MSYINQIKVDNTTYDIGAKNLVNGFTQTTAGANALDAAAGKTLNDTLTTTNNFLSHFKTDSTLTTTIDTMLANGFYAMNGSSAVGTFPDGTSKYGVLQSIKRGSGTFQFLYASGNLWEREVGSSVGSWTNLIDAKIDSRLPFYTLFFAVGSSSSVNLSVSSGSSGTTIFAFYSQGSNSNNGIISMRLGSSNATGFKDYHMAGTVDQLSATFNTSQSKLTITSSASSTMRFILFSERPISQL